MMYWANCKYGNEIPNLIDSKDNLEKAPCSVSPSRRSHCAHDLSMSISNQVDSIIQCDSKIVDCVDRQIIYNDYNIDSEGIQETPDVTPDPIFKNLKQALIYSTFISGIGAAGMLVGGYIGKTAAIKAALPMFDSLNTQVEAIKTNVKDKEEQIKQMEKQIEQCEEAFKASNSLLGLDTGDMVASDQAKIALHREREKGRKVATQRQFAYSIISSTIVLKTYYNGQRVSNCKGSVIKPDAILTAKHCVTTDDQISYGYDLNLSVAHIDRQSSKITFVPTDAQKAKRPIFTGIAIDPTRDVAVIAFSDAAIFSKQTSLPVIDSQPHVGEIAVLGKFINDNYFPLIGEIKHFILSNGYQINVAFKGEQGDSGSPIINLDGEIMGVYTSIQVPENDDKNKPLTSYFTYVDSKRVEELYQEAKEKFRKD